MSLTHEEVLELITLVQERPCLWRIKGRVTSRATRNKAWKEVYEKMKEKKPDVTEGFLKSKWNNIRSNFMAERRKVLASLSSGAGTDQVYQSSKFWYDAMDFITDQIEARPSTSNIRNEDDPEYNFEEEETVLSSVLEGRMSVAEAVLGEYSDQLQSSAPTTPTSTTPQPSTSTGPKQSTKKGKEKKPHEEVIALMGNATGMLAEFQKRVVEKPADLISTYLNYLEVRMRGMEPDKLKEFMKKIDKFYYEST